MTTIYLVRHAEAEGNVCRRIHGHFDTNITPNGMNQIRDLARRFADIPVDACYCSDLTRTRTTAQAIYVPKHLELQPDPAFREVAIGTWEDRTFGDLYAHCPDSIEMFSHCPQNWKTEGSETFEEYTTRFLKAMDAAVLAHPNGTIAIVSHGAVLRGVLHVLFPEAASGHADNTAVSCLTWEDGVYHLQYANDNSHLQMGRSLFATQHWWKEKNRGNDGTLWFREGPMKAAGERHYTALNGQTVLGYVDLSDEGAAMRITDLALDPSARGQNLSIQLLGQALFTARKAGKQQLTVEIPEDNLPMQSLCRKLFFQKRGSEYVLDLKIRVIPFP